MRKHVVWLLLFVLLFTGPASAAGAADESGWELVVPGIEFSQFQLPDPNNVFVARMDRTNPTVTLESTIANGKLLEPDFLGRETVSGMFSRYDQALNFWGGNTNPHSWGLRNQAVVGINGIYFNYTTGIPQGGQVQAGWYVQRYEDNGGWGGFTWKLDRSAFIGECVTHQPEKQVISYPATGVSQQIAHINTPREINDLVLYTPQWNSRTGTEDAGVEVLVEMTRPTMILPMPAFASGIVRQIYQDQGNNLIPFNSIVLSDRGTQGQTLLENVN
ncbi:MAG: hypothetical protein ACM3H7_01005, partial [Acidobacteriaceae bacterium]